MEGVMVWWCRWWRCCCDDDGDGAGAAVMMLLTSVVQVVSLLLERGADAGVRAGEGCNALMIATANDRIAIVR